MTRRFCAAKRGVAALLAAVLMLCNGCAYEFSLPGVTSPPAPEPAPSVTDYSDEFADSWSYRCLPSRLQQMYAAMYAAVRECSSDTTVNIRGADDIESDYLGLKIALPVPIANGDEARQLFNSFTADNPQFFFLGNTYSYEGYRLGDVNYYDVFCLTLTMDTATRGTAANAMEAAVTTLLSGIPDGADAYETELYLHDTLLSQVSYDRDTAANSRPAESRPSAFTAYGALVEGSAVCEGYSRAMQLLLHRSGIPCTLVSGGSSDGTSHMWNLVEIDGRAYHLDTTWDDADDYLTHTFFNLTTEEIRLSHTVDSDNLGVDTCTATEANYYRREQRDLDTYDRSLIAEAVARQVQSGADIVDLRFSPDKFANAQLFFSNSTRLSKYVKPFLNGGSLWDYSCQANDTYGTLTIYRE